VFGAVGLLSVLIFQWMGMPAFLDNCAASYGVLYGVFFSSLASMLYLSSTLFSGEATYSMWIGSFLSMLVLLPWLLTTYVTPGLAGNAVFNTIFSLNPVYGLSFGFKELSRAARVGQPYLALSDVFDSSRPLAMPIFWMIGETALVCFVLPFVDRRFGGAALAQKLCGGFCCCCASSGGSAGRRDHPQKWHGVNNAMYHPPSASSSSSHPQRGESRNSFDEGAAANDAALSEGEEDAQRPVDAALGAVFKDYHNTCWRRFVENSILKPAGCSTDTRKNKWAACLTGGGKGKNGACRSCCGGDSSGAGSSSGKGSGGKSKPASNSISLSGSDEGAVGAPETLCEDDEDDDNDGYGRQAVRGLSFVLRKGEFVGLVGPNGAGTCSAHSLSFSLSLLLSV
jgi:ABC-type multidrug transport system fused ATPase/permease subunit